ncbi:hypothetical protein ACS0TY_008441 [Phlomoides rotata]
MREKARERESEAAGEWVRVNRRIPRHRFERFPVRHSNYLNLSSYLNPFGRRRTTRNLGGEANSRGREGTSSFQKDFQKEKCHSFFVRNFSANCSPEFLRDKFCEFGSVVDIFIPAKLDKTGKPFGFVRFDIHHDEEYLLDSLNNTWIGSYKLLAYIPKYEHNTIPPWRNPQPHLFDANYGN